MLFGVKKQCLHYWPQYLVELYPFTVAVHLSSYYVQKCINIQPSAHIYCRQCSTNVFLYIYPMRI